MKIEQIYTGCLAQGAYFISSNGEAAIIDPLREVEPYLERAKKDGVNIKYVFETHFHADFVSGHLDLSKKTGAHIVFGPKATPEFECIVATDDQVFTIGNVSLTVLHTPGHTLESCTYLLKDENGKEVAIFSGDTLFLGDVGRPDLAQKAADMSQEQLAGMLYESLMNKIMPLPDEVIVYPAHGAGSACGKNMMKETEDTLGNQKKVNYALNQPDKESFIKAVTDGLLPPPGYFGMNVSMNKKGYSSLDEVMKKGLNPLQADEFEHLASSGEALVLDIRDPGQYAKGHIPRSINIGLKGDFAPWVGAMIVDVNQPLLLVTEPGTEEEALIRLSRVGFDQVWGYLEGGFEIWKKAGKETDTVNRIGADQFSTEIIAINSQILDVRKESEYENMHVVGAENQPLADINLWFPEYIEKKDFYIHCAGGYRSMIAASILKARGIHNFKEVEGGFKAISQTRVPLGQGMAAE
jgi:glyoxylase-like metal-dependent hydrolase (beta-lactamase superfamily II)/rhodanese-related sulfurtransferase